MAGDGQEEALLTSEAIEGQSWLVVDETRPLLTFEMTERWW